MLKLFAEDNSVDQQAHLDYTFTDDFVSETADASNLSVNMLVANGSTAFLKVWPESHKIMQRIRHMTKRIPQKLANELSAETSIRLPIKPEYIRIERGEIVVWRHDLIHAGCGYAEQNNRYV